MKVELHDWVEYTDYWMDDSISNGMSVAAFDLVSGRLAGAFTVKDTLFCPKGFHEKYSSNEEKKLTFVKNFCWDLDAEATKIMPELGESGKAADLWLLGVHPDFRGNKIAYFLTKAALRLIKKAGFKYATIEALSAFASKIALAHNFTAVQSVKFSDWLWKGKPVYIEKPPHGTATFWVKDLEELEN